MKLSIVDHLINLFFILERYRFKKNIANHTQENFKNYEFCSCGDHAFKAAPMVPVSWYSCFCPPTPLDHEWNWWLCIDD